MSITQWGVILRETHLPSHLPTSSEFAKCPHTAPLPTSLPTCRAVRALVALLTEAEPLLAVSSPTAGIQTPLLAAVLTHVALLAEAGAIDTSPLPRTVPRAPQLAAVLACVGLLADTLPVHTEPPGAAVSWAPELRAVASAVLAVADALAIHTHAPAGAAQGAVGLRAVLADPAFIADAAAGLEAEVAMAATVRDIVQLSWNGQGEGQRAALAPLVSGAGVCGGGRRAENLTDSEASPSLVHNSCVNISPQPGLSVPSTMLGARMDEIWPLVPQKLTFHAS